jgi:hypothetical protein
MGNVIRYWTQNSSPTDSGTLLKQFTDRLSHCGHEVKAVVHGIEKATKYVDESLTCKTTKMVLFLHWQYHLKDNMPKLPTPL